MEPKGIIIEVTEIRGGGRCSYGLKVGDRFEAREEGADFCVWAHQALFPFITALKFGGTLPWEEDPDFAFACCPDPHNTVVFKLTRKAD